MPDDLRKLDEEYQQKVLDGDMEKKKGNIGFQGKGYEFNEQEENKVKEFRKELSRAYGLGVEENDEMDEDNEMVKTAQQKEDERKKQEIQQVLQLLEKDPNARKIAMEAGNKASTKALKEGHSHDEAKQMAQEAMLYVLKLYKPATVTLEKGLDDVLRIRDQFVD